jgi:hypothetical protein
MKIGPVGSELFHVDNRIGRRTDGQADITKLIVVLATFRTRQKRMTRRETNKYIAQTNEEFSNIKLHGKLRPI